MQQRHELPDIPEQSFTTWYNPLDTPQTVILGHGDGPMGRPTAKVTIPPKGEKQIPRMYDQAIQRVHNGTVIGGLAPQLVNKSLEEPPLLADALNTRLMEAQTAQEMLARAALQKQAADTAILLAGAKVVETDAPKPSKK